MTATKRLGSEACKCLIYTCQASVQDYTCHICRLSGAEILLYASESLYVHCDRINVNTSKPVEVKISLCLLSQSSRYLSLQYLQKKW